MSQTTCPICEDPYTVQGMYGHLRFTHDLEGEELQARYDEAMRQKEELEAGADEKEPDLFNGEAEQEAGAEADETSDLPDAPTPQGQEGEPFNWEDRLERLESVRSDLKELERRFHPLKRFFFDPEDEGVNESLEALERIEMEIREQIGAEGQDQELRQSVDQSLDLVEGLTKCREQREAINQRFDGEEAERRVDRLGQREAEIRSEIRGHWDVGKPLDDLDSDDPLLDLEEPDEDTDSRRFQLGNGAISRLINS